MRREDAAALLSTVTRALAGVRVPSNLLDDIAWPKHVEAEFFAAGAAALPRPTYTFDRDGLEADVAELARVEETLAGEGPVHAWLRAVVRGVLDKDRLLLAVGTPAFGRISREIYGGARTTLPGMPRANVELADHLLERLGVHGWDAAADRDEAPVDAAAFAAKLTARIARHRPAIDLEVTVDDVCSAKALAGTRRVKVRAGATFLGWEADGLYAHEVETHAFTAQNGAAQTHAPFLKSGGPRATATQEGLAVFAELYERALATPRLERLATRVKLVALAEDGASFLDAYGWLLARGASPHDAFLDAARVYRGGLVEGGAAFTKDACYLSGMVDVYAFLSAFVRGGFRDEVELLACGRIALEDIAALVELQALGLVDRPKHRPRWMRDWQTLLPYFAFSSFVAGLDLRAIEAKYTPAIAFAGRATPPRP
jgi:uncharacterized protein (TIGR02421 family)